MPRDGTVACGRVLRVRPDRAARPVRRRGVPDRAERSRESYLRIDRIVDAARRAGADAVHPGYGFLSENEGSRAAVRDAGLTFIGPSPEVIALMGSKTAARAAAQRAGVAVVPGADAGAIAADATDDEIRRLARAVGYPLLVKAVSGGGGKGMRAVAGAADLAGAVRAARSEAGTAFGDAAVYLERRSCGRATWRSRCSAISTAPCCRSSSASVQSSGDTRRWSRRHRRRPSTPAMRQALTAAAAAVARSVGYSNAGTVEFLLDEDGSFYFLEMNTRLQVEHAITEMVTGLDLVQWQIRIARGERLDGPRPRAESPARAARSFDRVPDVRRGSRQPVPPVARARFSGSANPRGQAFATTAASKTGLDVSLFYDPMLSKLVVWGGNPRGESPGCAARSGNITSPESRRRCRFSGGCSISRSSPRAGFTRPTWTRCCGRATGAVRRSAARARGDRRDRRRHQFSPDAAIAGRPGPAEVESSSTNRRIARLTNGPNRVKDTHRFRKGLW